VSGKEALGIRPSVISIEQYEGSSLGCVKISENSWSGESMEGGIRLF
jgi:hypothetical protein